MNETSKLSIVYDNNDISPNINEKSLRAIHKSELTDRRGKGLEKNRTQLLFTVQKTNCAVSPPPPTLLGTSLKFILLSSIDRNVSKFYLRIVSSLY